MRQKLRCDADAGIADDGLDASSRAPAGSEQTITDQRTRHDNTITITAVDINASHRQNEQTRQTKEPSNNRARFVSGLERHRL